jgi:hypothetical protein
MSEEGTDAIREFRAEDVFELAGVGFDRDSVVEGQDVHEQAFGETMAADDAASALFAGWGEGDVPTVDGHETELFHFGGESPVLGDGEVGTFDVSVIDILVTFTSHPELFQDFVEILILLGGDFIDQVDVAVVQLKAAIGAAAHLLIVGDHEDGAALGVEAG